MLLHFFISSKKKKNNPSFNMSNYLSWSVLYSPAGNINLLTEATLFIATKRTPPKEHSLVSSYQALLGVIQGNKPAEKILIFDEGRPVPFEQITLKKNFLTARGESLNLFVAFSTDAEAEMCSESIELLSRGDLYEFKIRSAGNLPSTDLAEGMNLEDQVLSILRDPAFEELVREVETILFQHPEEMEPMLRILCSQ